MNDIIEGKKIIGPLHLHFQGARPSSRLQGMWYGFLRKTFCKPLVITGCNFRSSTYMPRWRDRLAAAWCCLRGNVPSNRAALEIHYDDD